jgi:5-(carboxyamino)imidazole ribonucleotide synthase
MNGRYDIGFLGGGQLARMSIQAAQRMGLRCLSLDPGENTPASQVADSIVGPLFDPESIAKVIEASDHVTLENEFIPAAAIRQAFQLTGEDEERLVPGIDTLATIQDKLLQRQAFVSADVPSPTAVDLDADAGNAIEQIGFPMVLKARFGGYDGKGTRYARTPDELETHRHLWEGGGWLAEAFVPFRRELAVMVFVGDQEAGCFPTMETVQTNHVCDLVFPSGADASAVALAAVRAVDGHGLFGVELFELETGEVLINELAPRPHNTGHYTLDWGGISQFEQHVRLAMGLPIVPPEGGETCMANLLGQPNTGDYRAGLRAALEGDAGVRVHWYGKAEAKPGRKMGHLTVIGQDAVTRAKDARERFYAAWTRR